jgi:hypothetical protein
VHLDRRCLKKTADNCAQVQDKKIQRLVQWNNELLLQLLKQVVTRRHAPRKEDGRRRLILWHLTLEMDPWWLTKLKLLPCPEFVWYELQPIQCHSE